MSTDNPKPKPTFDERLEAVIQTLELVAAMQRDHEIRHERQLAESEERWNRRFAQWDARFDKLLTIVESHERRIDGLERGQQ